MFGSRSKKMIRAASFQLVFKLFNVMKCLNGRDLVTFDFQNAIVEQLSLKNYEEKNKHVKQNMRWTYKYLCAVKCMLLSYLLLYEHQPELR